MNRKKTLAKPQRRLQRRNEGTRQWWLYLAIPAVVVIVIGVGASLLGSGAAPFGVQEAYAYTTEHGNELKYIPCFCGCGQHDGHTSIHDCFIKKEHLSGGPVVKDEHGANCDMCVEIIRQSSKMIQEGKTLRQVRQSITSQYGNIGPSTNTPPPPAN